MTEARVWQDPAKGVRSYHLPVCHPKSVQCGAHQDYRAAPPYASLDAITRNAALGEVCKKRLDQIELSL